VNAMTPQSKIINLDSIRFHAITEAQCTALIMFHLAQRTGGWVVTLNLDILRRCRKDPAFRALVSQADVIVADGMPLVWASRLQRTPVPERVAGSNLIWSLSEAAAREQRSIFLLGGEPGAAEGAAKILQGRSPELVVAGTCCPPVGFERSDAEVRSIRQALDRAQPDIVYVALGSPKQDRLIQELRPLLPRAWWLGVGISLSFVAGRIRRAPSWMQRTGLEWVHRVAQEPARLARRYFVDDVPYGCRLLLRSTWLGLHGDPKESTPLA